MSGPIMHTPYYILGHFVQQSRILWCRCFTFLRCAFSIVTTPPETREVSVC
jgi:hypothetical protein